MHGAFRAALVGWAAVLAAGCSLQATSGLAGVLKSERELRAATRLQGSLVRVRHSGWSAGGALWLEHERGAANLRAGLMHVGYVWRQDRLGPIGAELAYELGLGEPPGVEMRGRGLYNGAGAWLLWPLPWFGPDRHRFYLAHLGVDVVLGGTFGVWAAPEDVDRSERLAWSGQLGVRLSVGSDVVLGPEER